MHSPGPVTDRRRSCRWYVGAGVLAAVECVALLGFGILLGLTDIAVADTVPAGIGRSIVFVIALGMSIGAVLLANRTVSGARSRRPRSHRRNLSTDSQTHNLSIRGLNWRFRRG